jgi:rhodanese-related sulfurtransferase
MLKKLFPALLIVLLTVASAGAFWFSGGYNYISAEEVQSRLENGPSMILLDICAVEQFSKGHIPGSIETNAYPVQSDADRERLAKVLPKIQDSSDQVVIVCPGGGSGAKRTVDYYKAQGVDEERLLILEKGMNNWPYETVSN